MLGKIQGISLAQLPCPFLLLTYSCNSEPLLYRYGHIRHNHSHKRELFGRHRNRNRNLKPVIGRDIHIVYIKHIYIVTRSGIFSRYYLK